MSALGRLETWIQSLVEEPFRRLSSRRIQPVEIARRLAVAIDDHVLVTDSRPLAANSYVVELSSEDYVALDGVSSLLRSELALFVTDHARDRDYQLVGEVLIALRSDAAMPVGRVVVTGKFTEDWQQTPEVGQTRVLPTILRSAPARSGRARLSDPNSRKSWVLQSDQALLIGRDADSDIAIDDASVSRTHARVRQITLPGKSVVAIEVEDLGSTNGTTIDSREISVAVVTAGGSLRVGDVTLFLDEAKA